jgi:photosystem II stability/assembly factor-like uncharacterized protein
MKLRNDVKHWFAPIILAIMTMACFVSPIMPGQSPTSTVAAPPTIIKPATASASPTNTPRPTATPSPTPTPVPLAWKQIDNGYDFPRDSILAIAFDPVNQNVLYVGTLASGIYKSTDGGNSWQSSNAGIQMTNVTRILVNQQDPNIILVRSDKGVYRSSDGGDTWELQIAGLTSATYPVMDVLDSNHLVLHTEDSGNNIYETTDGGATWELVNSSIDWGEILLVIGKKIYFNTSSYSVQREAYSTEDYGLTRFQLNLAWQDRLYYQVDRSGQTWLVAGRTQERNQTRLYYRTNNGGLTWLAIGEYDCFQTTSSKDYSTLYSICSGMLMKTNDGGGTWTQIGTAQANPTVLAVSPISTNTILVAGASDLRISRDGGSTWKAANEGLGNVSLKLSIDPADPSKWYAESLIVQLDLGNIDNESICGQYRSVDAGTSWVTLNNLHGRCNLNLDGSGNLYKTDLYLILKSTNHGNSWFELNRPHSFAAGGRQRVIPHPYSANRLYAIYTLSDTNWYGFIEVSQDGGRTWQVASVQDGSSLPHGSPLLGFSHTTGRIYLYSINWRAQSLNYSNDYGISWHTCTQQVEGVTSILVQSNNSDQVLIGTNGNGIFQSKDGCATWEKTNLGLGNLSINSLAADPANPNTIYTGTDGGAYVSFDGGQTWSQINDGLTGSLVIYSIVVDSRSNVFAATPFGIYQLEHK